MEVPVSECRAQNHQVIHAQGNRSAPFSELIAAASKQPLPRKEELRLKTDKEFRYIGKGVPASTSKLSAPVMACMVSMRACPVWCMLN